MRPLKDARAHMRSSAPSPAIIHEPQPAELPARRRIEEIAIADTRVPGGRRVRAAAQHHLVDHELAVVLAERALRRAIPWVGQIGAAGPLPDDAESVVEKILASRHFTFGFRRQVLT